MRDSLFYISLLIALCEHTTKADVDECSTGQHTCGDVSRCRNTNGSYYCLCPGWADTGVSSSSVSLAWGDSCFSITTSSVTWKKARIKCKQHAADLLVIGTRSVQYQCSECLRTGDSADKPASQVCHSVANEWLAAQIKRIFMNSGAGTRWWVGLHKPADDSEFQWVDGTALNETNITWNPGEPTDNNLEKCVEMFFSGQMNDIRCDTRYSYICELNTAVDECQDKESCDTNAQCTNIPGGYNCTCHSGYHGNDYNCSDVDECQDKESCDTNAHCTNIPGGYNCTCHSGYHGNGYNCSDVDECQDKESCDTNAQCTNIPGGYNCTCHSGYNGNGYNCSDDDECNSSSKNPCHPDANCTNIPGHYDCVCKQGFNGNGKICTDIDECSVESSCHSDATCDNSPGGHTCTCRHGFNFTDDGYTCIPGSSAEEQSQNQQVVTYIGVASASGVGLIGLFIAICVIFLKRRRKTKKATPSHHSRGSNITFYADHDYVNVGMDGIPVINEEGTPSTDSSSNIPTQSLSQGTIEDLLYANHKINKETRTKGEEGSVEMTPTDKKRNDTQESKPKLPPKPKVISKIEEIEVDREELYSNKYILDRKNEQRNKHSDRSSPRDNGAAVNSGIQQADQEVEVSATVDEQDTYDHLEKSRTVRVLDEDDGYGHLYGSALN